MCGGVLLGMNSYSCLFRYHEGREIVTRLGKGVGGGGGQRTRESARAIKERGRQTETSRLVCPWHLCDLHDTCMLILVNLLKFYGPREKKGIGVDSLWIRFPT